MFVELTEHLRCTENHAEVHCVLMTGVVADRRVVRGIVGCPECGREYPIAGSILRFALPDPARGPARDLPDPETLQALLDLSGAGGYVVLVGSGVRAAAPLSSRLEGVHLVGVNAPEDIAPGPQLTLLEADGRIPLRTSMARGVVLGAERSGERWAREATRVLLPGLRMVALADTVAVEGVEKVVAEKGIWVGKKRREAGSGKREG